MDNGGKMVNGAHLNLALLRHQCTSDPLHTGRQSTHRCVTDFVQIVQTAPGARLDDARHQSQQTGHVVRVLVAIEDVTDGAQCACQSLDRFRLSHCRRTNE